MLPDRSYECVVTIGLLSGTTKTGRIARFSPHMPDLSLLSRGAGAGRVPTRSLLRAEDIAYVAFGRREESPPIDSPKNPKRLRIHVAGRRTFLILVPPSELNNPLGFYAVPAETASPFEEVFFYCHGINIREDLEPIGGMLMEAGVLRAPDLEKGIVAQNEERTKPLGKILVDQNKIDAESVEAAAILQKRKHQRLGEILVEVGLITPKDVEIALSEQKRGKGKRIGEVLVELGVLKEEDLAQVLAKKFHLAFVNLDEFRIHPGAAAEVSPEIIKKYRVLPVDMDAESLTIAISDPLETEVIDVLRMELNRKIREVLACRSQVEAYVTAHLEQETALPLEPEDEPVESEMGNILNELRASEAEPEDARTEEGDPASDASAIVKLVNRIITDAYRRGASDIHIEPNGSEEAMTIRFRVDGECVEYQEIPAKFRNRLVARLKIIAKLDIAERRKPQDGKIRFRVLGKWIELRVATIPTVNNNEDMVLRILAASKPIPLAQMGLSERNLRVLQKMITRPYGMVLCVGPTGSGKTTTLHSALGAINTIDTKIWTAEDPVEISQKGLRQVQVQPKIGFTFAHALRAFLRADPDVIMVGEMRDPETASIAVESSLTGHLVFSTLHTNSAPETVSRLLDMGLEPFSFSDALLGVLAQRLVRGLCKECRDTVPATKEQYEDIAVLYGRERLASRLPQGTSELRLWRGRGCSACNNTGYKGRVAVHELLVADDEVKRAITRHAPVAELRDLAIAGGMTLLVQDGIEKALAGLTDMTQVFAVCTAKV